MTPQPGTAGTDDDPLDSIETKELVVNGEVIGSLVGLAFDSATASDGVLRFDGSGSTNGITDGSAKVIVNGTVHDVAGGEWVDFSGTSHSLDSWEKVVNSQFDVSITGVSPDPVAPGNTLDVTADVTNNGTDSDTQTVTLDINNGVGRVDSANVTLSGGGSVTKTLSWSVPSGQTEQDYTATVASADDSASQTVTVGSGVPSSAIHRYRFDEGGGTTLTDSIGSATGSVSGASWIADSSLEGGTGLSFDGTDDKTSYPIDLSQYSEWGIGVTLNSPNPNDNNAPVVYAPETGSFGEQAAEYNGFSGGDGEVDFQATDGNNTVTATSGTDLRDGNNHRIFIGLRENDKIALYIDGALASDTPFGTMGPVGNQIYNMYHSRLDKYQSGIVDHMIVYNSWDASVAQSDYDIQPWS